MNAQDELNKKEAIDSGLPEDEADNMVEDLRDDGPNYNLIDDDE